MTFPEFMTNASTAVAVVREIVAAYREARGRTASSGVVDLPGSPNTDHVERAAIRTASEWLSAVQSIAPANAPYHLPHPDAVKSIADLERFLENLQLPEIVDRLEVMHAARALPPLAHSRLSIVDPTQIAVLLGISNETAPLRGRRVLFDKETNIVAIPTFRITMLGASGSGKTAYMAAMYNSIVDGIRDLALRATTNGVDLELRDHMERILLDGAWPKGTSTDMTTYEFQLMLSGQVLANVDWVDYRGADAKIDNEDGQRLIERVRASHAILWMVNMDRIPPGTPVDSQKARMHTEVGRYAAVCRMAMKDVSHPKAWIFVRTRSDKVRSPDGRADWKRASKELHLHLGDTAKIARTNSMARGYVVPVSACGKVDAENNPIGDGAVHVEWPLFLALYSLTACELVGLRGQQYDVEQERREAERSGLASIISRFLSQPPTEAELRAIEKSTTIQHALLTKINVMQYIMQGCPDCIIPV